MDRYKAKQIPIEQFIEKTIGLQPIGKIKQLIYFPNPLVDTDDSKSFFVNKKNNIYRCTETKSIGSLVDLGCRLYNCNATQFLKKLDQFNFKVATPKVSIYESHVEIVRIKPITNPELYEYALSRKIQPEVLKHFCEQVTYRINSVQKLAIGFKNISRGWELRGENFKAAIAPRTLAHVGWINISTCVFEGFFDFLSFHQLKNFENSKINCTILNGHTLRQATLNRLNQLGYIYLFLDNDNKGKKLAKKITDSTPRNVIDCSYLYKDFKDLNDYLINKKDDENFNLPALKSF